MKNEAFVKTEAGQIVNLFFSDNPPVNPETATGVVSVNVYDEDGYELDGGEFDIQSSGEDIRMYIKDSFEFMDLGYVPYTFMSEEEFYSFIEAAA